MARESGGNNLPTVGRRNGLGPLFLAGKHNPGNHPGQNVEEAHNAQHRHGDQGSRQDGDESYPRVWLWLL